MIATKTIYRCDLCDREMGEGQGFGLRGAKSELQYTRSHELTQKHICNGCLCALQWIHDHSVGKSVPGKGKSLCF